MGQHVSAVLPKLQTIPPSIATIGDYETAARERVAPDAFAYLDGGASDETTLRDNISAFGRIKLRSRILRDLEGGHCRVELFGQTLDFPVLLAPVAYQRLAHPDGEIASAMGAAAARAGMVLSSESSTEMEAVAAQAPDLFWFQLYIQPDRDFTLRLVRRAEEAGCKALVVTVDAPISGLRPREQRAGFRLPPGVEAVNLRGARSLARQESRVGGPVLLGGPLLAAAPTWRDIAWLRSHTNLPLLVKGVTNREDAQQAIGEGVDGVVASNHGGRVLDGQPAALDILPEVVDAVGARVPVLFDGGVRSGADVFKAIALGAKAVLVGRAYMYGLAAAGAVGVSHVLHMLRAELEATMTLTGCRNLSEIDRRVVRD